MKTLAERLGRDPNTEEHIEDLQWQLDALAKRVKAMEDSPSAAHKDVPKAKH